MDCGDLWHADAGHDARRADGTGADADFDRIGAGVGQCPGARRRRHIAGDEQSLVEALPDVRKVVKDGFAVSVRRVQHQRVRAGLDQKIGALEIVLSDGGGDQQASLVIFAGVGEPLTVEDVLDGDEAAQTAVVVGDDDPLNAVPVQQIFDGRHFEMGADRHQFFLRGHHFAQRAFGVFFEPHVAVGDDANDKILGVNDGEAGDVVLFLHRPHLRDGHVGVDGHRLVDNAAFVAFDFFQLARLRFGGKVFVDDAKAAGLRHGDGHGRDSVTVSIAAERSGMVSPKLRAKRVEVSTSAGNTSEYRGSSRTSSKVKASFTDTPRILHHRPRPAGQKTGAPFITVRRLAGG